MKTLIRRAGYIDAEGYEVLVLKRAFFKAQKEKRCSDSGNSPMRRC